MNIGIVGYPGFSPVHSYAYSMLTIQTALLKFQMEERQEIVFDSAACLEPSDCKETLKERRR